jgi:uncharacterized Zn-binding protein involved in type VI secretion
MIQKRYHITLGAGTSAGGKVTTASSLMSINGARIALEGDKVSCPVCNTEGIIRIDGPRLSERFNSRQVALSDDLCICSCNPPPKLVADQAVKCQLFVLAPEELARQVSSTAERAIYNEQPRLVAPPIEGVPYFIETPDGRTFSGRTGSGGLLPRIDTHGEDEYTVLWGDEALAKMEPVGG